MCAANSLTTSLSASGGQLLSPEPISTPSASKAACSRPPKGLTSESSPSDEHPVGVPLEVRQAAHVIVQRHSNLAFIGGGGEFSKLSNFDAIQLAQSIGAKTEAVPCAPAPNDSMAEFIKLRQVCKTLNLADSGSGVHAVNSTKYAVPGSVRTNTTAIATANGVTVPPTKCTARVPFRTLSGQRKWLTLDDCLILTDSEHNLVSLGRLALDQHIGTTIGAGARPSQLTFPDGSGASLLNVGVLVMPDANAKPCAAVTDDDSPTHGADGRQNVSWNILHARLNHRPYSCLRDMVRCVRNCPEAWSPSTIRAIFGSGSAMELAWTW